MAKVKSIEYWYRVAKGEEVTPDNVRVVAGTCRNKHWPDNNAVRYISTNNCVICIKRSAKKVVNVKLSDPERTRNRRIIEDIIAAKLEAAHLNWFDDIE